MGTLRCTKFNSSESGRHQIPPLTLVLEREASLTHPTLTSTPLKAEVPEPLLCPGGSLQPLLQFLDHRCLRELCMSLPPTLAVGNPGSSGKQTPSDWCVSWRTRRRLHGPSWPSVSLALLLPTQPPEWWGYLPLTLKTFVFGVPF